MSWLGEQMRVCFGKTFRLAPEGTPWGVLWLLVLSILVACKKEPPQPESQPAFKVDEPVPSICLGKTIRRSGCDVVLEQVIQEPESTPSIGFAIASSDDQNFGLQDINVEKVNRIHFRNTGDRLIEIRSITVGSDQFYEKENSRCPFFENGKKIPPGAVCVIEFAFKSTAPGTYKAEVDLEYGPVDDSELQKTLTAKLEGQSRLPSQLSLNVGCPVDLGANHEVASTVTQDFILKNNGESVTAEVRSVTLNQTETNFQFRGNSSFPGDNGTCSLGTMGPGAECSFGLQVKIPQKGFKGSASLEIVYFNGQTENKLTCPLSVAEGVSEFSLKRLEGGHVPSVEAGRQNFSLAAIQGTDLFVAGHKYNPQNGSFDVAVRKYRKDEDTGSYELDPNFGISGISQWAHHPTYKVHPHSPEGVPDYSVTLGTGVRVSHDRARAIKIDSRGRILVAVSSSGFYRTTYSMGPNAGKTIDEFPFNTSYLMRLTSTGKLDSSFGLGIVAIGYPGRVEYSFDAALFGVQHLTLSEHQLNDFVIREDVGKIFFVGSHPNSESTKTQVLFGEIDLEARTPPKLLTATNDVVDGDIYLTQIKSLDNGELLLVGRGFSSINDNYALIMIRVDTNLSIKHSQYLSPTDEGHLIPHTVRELSDGRLIVMGGAWKSTTQSIVFIHTFGANLQPDGNYFDTTAFMVTLAPVGDPYLHFPTGLHILSNGDLLVSSASMNKDANNDSVFFLHTVLTKSLQSSTISPSMSTFDSGFTKFFGNSLYFPNQMQSIWYNPNNNGELVSLIGLEDIEGENFKATFVGTPYRDTFYLTGNMDVYQGRGGTDKTVTLD